MKKTKLLFVMLVAVLVLIFPLTINASDGSKINPEKYNSSGPSDSDVAEMYKFGGSVAGVIQVVGTAVSVGAMLIIGIRYVMASADEKAEYRDRMIPYFIGAVLLFGAVNIIKIIDSIIN